MNIVVKWNIGALKCQTHHIQNVVSYSETNLMNNIYLTDDLKKYYVNSLLEIINCDDEFWNLDNGTEEHLISINQNNNIGTIYSKRGKGLSGKSFHSYLRIVFTKSIERRLIGEVLPTIIKDYNSLDNVKCKFEKIEPYIQAKKESSKNNHGLKCIVDPNYFNIKNILIELKNGNHELHAKFWNDLSCDLSNLKPDK